MHMFNHHDKASLWKLCGKGGYSVNQDVFFFPQFLCPCIERSGEYCFTVVRLSVCPTVRPSVRLSVWTNLTWKQHFHITPKLIYLQGSYLVWRHISSICICLYQGQGHLQRSRSDKKVTFLKNLPFLGHSCFTNTSCCYHDKEKLHFEPHWNCRLQKLSIWTKLKFCHLPKGWKSVTLWQRSNNLAGL